MFGLFKKGTTNGRQRPTESFILPVGVMPIHEGKMIPVDLHNGFLKHPSKNPRFKAAYQISLSADRIEALVKAFVSKLLPETCYAILEWNEITRDRKQRDHMFLTGYQSKKSIIAGLQPFFFRLINDGFVGFGFACSDMSTHQEIFINPKKIVQIVTPYIDETERILRDLNIPAFQQPRFITEYQTVNGDLKSMADLVPQNYAGFNSQEYSSNLYIPQLVKALGFKEKQNKP